MKNSDPVPLKVTGKSKLYIVIGDPISQVRSTHLYNKMAYDINIDAVFVPIQFAAKNFLSVMDSLRKFKNLAGVIPTIPHKANVLNCVDRCTERATQVGAVNSIRIEPDGSWVGDTFDGVGYVNGLHHKGYETKGRSFLLIGTGGAGSAIAFALAENGVSRLHIQELDEQKLSKVVAGIEKNFPEIPVTTGSVNVADFDVIANATPLGMSPTDPLPINLNAVRKGQLVTDMIMSPDVTPLLVDALKRGCNIHKGYEALLGQAKANMEFFGYGE